MIPIDMTLRVVRIHPFCEPIRRCGVEPASGMQAEEVGGYNTYRLNQFPVVQQGGLVLNVIVGYPALDLVP